MLSVGAVFGALAVGLWWKTGSIFYLFNFSIIGGALMLGMGLWPVLPRRHKPWARRTSQLLVGGYMFFGLGMGFVYLGFGVIIPENMQIEGFWFWLFAGMSAASVLHYLVAKIFGTLIFNRGWCGWACWTVGVLDLLPWKRPPGRISRKWEYFRYAHFVFGIGLVSLLVFHFRYDLNSTLGIVQFREINPMKLQVYPTVWRIPELWWFLGGNIVYYGSGIALAIGLRDNRAFCKYVCPIVAFLKIGATISLMRVKTDRAKCTGCGTCDENCPMDIRITDYIRQGRRVTSTECIICQTCTSVCPEGVLRISIGFDLARDGHFRRIRPEAP